MTSTSVTRALLLVVALVVGVALIALVVPLGSLFVAHDFNIHFLWIDGCLDFGGCWDDVDKVCRKHEANAQALCDRSRPYRSATQ